MYITNKTVAIKEIIVIIVNNVYSNIKLSIFTKSKIITTKLFNMCKLIVVKILSVFKYRIHIHIPNINALAIPTFMPKAKKD